jgi:hypothetical protein
VRPCLFFIRVVLLQVNWQGQCGGLNVGVANSGRQGEGSWQVRDDGPVVGVADSVVKVKGLGEVEVVGS